MRKHTANSVIAFLFLVSTIVYFSCRKVDGSIPPISPEKKEINFFTRFPAKTEEAKSIVDFVKRYEEKSPFISKTVSRVGYPHWDKTISVRNGFTAGRQTAEDTSVYCIPFSLEEEARVNAIMVVKATDIDTVFYFLCDWEYQRLQTDADTSLSSPVNRYAYFFMSMNKYVFSLYNFHVEDTMLFRHENTKASRIDMVDPDLVEGKITVATVCQTFIVTLVFCPFVGYPECTPTCDLCYLCAKSVRVEECYEVDDFLGSGIFSGIPTGGSGGGGTGSPAGSPPSECGGGVAVGKILIPQGCGPGWLPILEEDSDPITEKLRKISLALNAAHDTEEMYELARNNNNSEYGEIIVSKNKQFYSRNRRTDNLPDRVKPDWTINADETLEGDMHIHTNPIITNRGAPSANDIFNLYGRPKYHVRIIECGNVRFALVINDQVKCNRWIKKHPLAELKLDLWATAEANSEWGTSRQNASKNAVAIILGRAADCGITFFVSNNTDKTEYTQLN